MTNEYVESVWWLFKQMWEQGLVYEGHRVTPYCGRCGTAFECNLGGECWCSAEPYRLPVPDAGAADCLCPACLRVAARQGAVSHRDGSHWMRQGYACAVC